MRDLLYILVFFAAQTPAAAQTVLFPGFTVHQVNTNSSQPNGLVFAPGGAFGDDLYVAISGSVLRTQPYTGVVSTFAAGLSTGTNSPSAAAFDNGAFSTGLLYVCQNDGSVVSVSAAGNVVPFAAGGALTSCNDLLFPGGAYGSNLLVANGDLGPTGNVSTVTATGSSTVLANFTKVPQSLAIPPAGSAFPSEVYVSLVNGSWPPSIVRVSPTGVETPFVTFNFDYAVDMAFASRAPFGDYLYYTTTGGYIRRISPAGVIQTFGTGFGAITGWLAPDLSFSPDGRALYVSSYFGVVVIRACETGIGQGNTLFVAELELNGAGEQGCQGPAPVGLVSGGSVTLRWRGPPFAPILLIVGTLNPAHAVLGCIGSLDVGIPPAYSDVTIVDFGAIDSNGNFTLVVPLPVLPPGPFLDVQGLVFIDPSFYGCPARLTSAFTTSVL
jgi:hypothetical protein